MAPEQHELHRALGRLEGKLDAVLENQERAVSETKDINQRVSKVEAKLNWYAGVSAAFIAAVSMFGDRIRHALFG